MLNKNRLFGWSLFLLSIIYLFACVAQEKPKVQLVADDGTWQTEEWVSDGDDYRELRLQVEKDMAQSQKAALITGFLNYELKVKDNPDDAKTQFQRAVAFHEMRTRLESHDLPDGSLVRVLNGLRKTKSPQNPEWTRIRLFIEKRKNMNTPLKEVTERILKRYPNDYWVKFYLLTSLKMREKEEQRRAIRYANDLVKAAPDNPSSYSAVADVYRGVWLNNNMEFKDGKWRWMGGKQDQESLKKAIEAARKYLQMLPEDSERRPLIENYLRAMEQGKP
jgi:hypothetical protein